MKSEWVETAISEVIQVSLPAKGLPPPFQQLREQLIQAITHQELPFLMSSLFSSFYDSSCPFERRFEVESELLPRAYQDHLQDRLPVYALAKAVYEDIASLWHAKDFSAEKLSNAVKGQREKPTWSLIGDYMAQTFVE